MTDNVVTGWFIYFLTFFFDIFMSEVRFEPVSKDPFFFKLHHNNVEMNNLPSCNLSARISFNCS